MAKFGWAYIDCGDSGSNDGGAYGPTGSVQFMSGAGNTSGTINFMYHSSSVNSGDFTANTLVLTGTLVVSGTISASHYHIKDIAEIGSTGSTYFGDSNGDVHARTGSLYVGKVGLSPTFTVDSNNDQAYSTGVRGMYTAVTATGITSSNASYIYGVTQTGDVEIRIHSASVAQAGAVYVIKDQVTSRTGDITLYGSVGGSGTETIDGEISYVLSGDMPAISLYSNGSNWFVF
jgi:hypothetical protein